MKRRTLFLRLAVSLLVLLLFAQAGAAESLDKDSSTLPLKLGSTGTQVKVVQKQLKNLGYYSSSYTVVYDKTTRSAVALFQSANGLAATGVANVETRTLLNAGTGLSYDAYKEAQSVLPVSFGSRGLAVKLLQDRLRELYYTRNASSGVYNKATATAVIKFQKYNGLSQTGAADLNTRSVMNSSFAVSRASVEGLLPGDMGDEVKAMVARLRELGYFRKAVTNKYGSAVRYSVKLFQKFNSLSTSGNATVETLNTLYSSAAVSYSSGGSGGGSGGGSATSDAKIKKLISIAYNLLGRPYSSGANPPKSFDCSRFTKYVFGKVGVSLSGEVSAQGRSTKGKRITALTDLKAGDLLFFDTQTEKSPGHSALYLGDQKFIHASSAAGSVVVTPFKDWYQERFMWGIRVW